MLSESYLCFWVAGNRDLGWKLNQGMTEFFLKLDCTELWIGLLMGRWDVTSGFGKALIVSGLKL